MEVDNSILGGGMSVQSHFLCQRNPPPAFIELHHNLFQQEFAKTNNNFRRGVLFKMKKNLVPPLKSNFFFQHKLLCSRAPFKNPRNGSSLCRYYIFLFLYFSVLDLNFMFHLVAPAACFFSSRRTKVVRIGRIHL